ncbi:hypothetical protein PR048_032790 [Dryococelus australis]|uniref:Uncharacterized protein n=1 Tax=Dryococelus australis TaxID=614101 RepID=A0ABQ9G3Z2_9NEOP|nr:hypothetical protein PR048_032790 [Dryococelus australis]
MIVCLSQQSVLSQRTVHHSIPAVETNAETYLRAREGLARTMYPKRLPEWFACRHTDVVRFGVALPEINHLLTGYNKERCVCIHDVIYVAFSNNLNLLLFRVFMPCTVSLLASHNGEPCSIPGRVTPRFLNVIIVPDDVASQRVFSGISCFPRRFIPALLHTLITHIGSRDLTVMSRPNISTLFTSFAFTSMHFNRNVFQLGNTRDFQKVPEEPPTTITHIQSINGRMIMGSFEAMAWGRRSPVLFMLSHSDWPAAILSAMFDIGHGGVVVRLPASHLCKPCSIPDYNAHGISHLGIMPDDADDRASSRGDLPFPTAFSFRRPVVPSWFETQSEIVSKIGTGNCCAVRVQNWTGVRDEVHFEPLKLAVRNLDPRSAAIPSDLEVQTKFLVVTLEARFVCFGRSTVNATFKSVNRFKDICCVASARNQKKKKTCIIYSVKEVTCEKDERKCKHYRFSRLQFLNVLGAAVPECFPPPLHSGGAQFSPHFTLICSQNLVVESCPNLSTRIGSKLTLRQVAEGSTARKLGFLCVEARPLYNNRLSSAFHPSLYRCSQFADVTLPGHSCIARRFSGSLPMTPMALQGSRLQDVDSEAQRTYINQLARSKSVPEPGDMMRLVQGDDRNIITTITRQLAFEWRGSTLSNALRASTVTDDIAAPLKRDSSYVRGRMGKSAEDCRALRVELTTPQPQWWLVNPKLDEDPWANGGYSISSLLFLEVTAARMIHIPSSGRCCPCLPNNRSPVAVEKVLSVTDDRFDYTGDFLQWPIHGVGFVAVVVDSVCWRISEVILFLENCRVLTCFNAPVVSNLLDLVVVDELSEYSQGSLTSKSKFNGQVELAKPTYLLRFEEPLRIERDHSYSTPKKKSKNPPITNIPIKYHIEMSEKASSMAKPRRTMWCRHDLSASPRNSKKKHCRLARVGDVHLYTKTRLGKVKEATGTAESRMEAARVCETELVASSSHQTALGRARSAARLSSL